jgi:hypothetical protein
MYWQSVERRRREGQEKLSKREVCTMFRATLTLNNDYVWSGLFDHHPNMGEVIDRWRSEDQKSSTFDKLEVVKE